MIRTVKIPRSLRFLGMTGRRAGSKCHFDPFGQAQGKLRDKSFFTND